MAIQDTVIEKLCSFTIIKKGKVIGLTARHEIDHHGCSNIITYTTNGAYYDKITTTIDPSLPYYRCYISTKNLETYGELIKRGIIKPTSVKRMYLFTEYTLCDIERN